MSRSDAAGAIIVVQVQAMVTDGKIKRLIGDYPALPRASLWGSAEAPSSAAVASSNAVAIGPGFLFLGSALGLILSALLIVHGTHWVRTAVQRKRRLAGGPESRSSTATAARTTST